MRYFAGSARHRGEVSAIPSETFSELCEALAQPFKLLITREEFHALPKKDKAAPLDQNRAKLVDYIVPAVFKSSPSPRNYESATHCNLIALDVDLAEQALQLIQPGAFDALGGYGFIAWHTATSTAEAPRLRILVHTEAVPIASYRDAVKTIAGLLKLPTPNPESLVPVQPMFLPTVFAGEEASPIFACNPEGNPFLEIAGGIPEVSVKPTGDEDDVLGDLTHYRAPMENISREEVKEALATLDPDMSMHGWIEMAAALKHQFGEDGYELWDEWSAKGKKYVDSDETAYRWGTLKAQPRDRAPVTIRSLLKLAQEAGWTNEALAKKSFEETAEWLRSDTRSSEELFDQGASKIAQASVTLGAMERKALMVILRDALAARKMPLPIADIRQAVAKVEQETSKSAGIAAWAQGLCYVTSVNAFYRYTTDRRFPPEVIDLMYAPIPMGNEQTMRPRDYLMRVAEIPQVENLRYDPRNGQKRYFSDNGVPYVNTYRADFAKPDPARANEAGDIFQKHIANLIREPDYQRVFIDFLAYQVQFPGKKIRWATLLQGGQGAGKTAIAVAMSAVLGKRNVRKLSASEVLDSQYNDWAYGKQLVVMEEVRIIGHNRHGIMDKLKPCISDDDISVSRKYEHSQTVPNITNYLMFTNHHDALAINDGDRRYFVLSSPLQHAHEIAAMGGAKYFDRLFAMISDNAGGLRAWFENWTFSSKFKPEDRAPHTRYLNDLADNAASPLTAAVKQTIEDEPHALVRKDLLSVGCLRNHIDPTQAQNFSDQALANVLRELGWTKADRIMLDGIRHNMWTKGYFRNLSNVAAERLEIL